MLTASELGLTPEEFEAAMNVERMYSVVSKSECHNCGKTPVTHADTTLWKLFCNKCGKQHSKARKISITNFKSSEIDRFERDLAPPATQNYRREPSPKPRHQSSKKSKKSKKRQRRYTSSSSSSDVESSSVSSSSSYVKKKSKSSKRKNHHDASPPPQITYEDPINPPSAFGGADQQTSGMAAIKSNEVRYMQHLPPSIPQPTMQQQQRGPLHPFVGQSATPTQSQAWQAPGYPAPQERPPFHMVSPPRGSFAMNLPPGAPPQLSAPSYPMVNQQQRVASSWSQPPMMGSSNQWGQELRPYNTPPRISTSNGAANPFRKTNLYPMPKARTNPYLSNQSMQTYRIPSPVDTSSKYPWNNNAIAAHHQGQNLYRQPALPPPTNTYDRTWC